MRYRCCVAVVASAIALGGCSFGEDDVAPVGDIVFTFQRGGTSMLPPEADSALVRIWDRSTGSSTLRAFAISPEVSASVSIEVSAYVGSLYQVDVVAYHTEGGGHRIALAAGEAQGVTVSARQNTVLHFQISPWTATLDAPDTLAAGESATLTLTLGDVAPVDDVFAGDATLSYTVGPTGAPQQVNVTRNGRVVTATLVVPDVAADTALYLHYGFDIDPETFGSAGTTFTADVPETMVGEALLRRPVRAAQAGARGVR